MIILFEYLFLICCLIVIIYFIWSSKNERKYKSLDSVANAYDKWTNDSLLETLWGEHIHLGYYSKDFKKQDFRQAKIDFVHKLVDWTGLNNLPKGSRILDVGCGIGGSSRILANDYGFDVVGITISSAQVIRAKQLTSDNLSCSFEVMNALDIKFADGSFDGVWSVEAGPHMPDKQLYADQMLRVLRPGGILSIADWNKRDSLERPITQFEKIILQQLLDQWSHPDFSTISGFKNNLINSPFNLGNIETDDWTKFTIPSWNDSIMEGFRRSDEVLKLGGKSFFQGLREIPTILMMRWAFANGLMQFGVFRKSI